MRLARSKFPRSMAKNKFIIIIFPKNISVMKQTLASKFPLPRQQSQKISFHRSPISIQKTVMKDCQMLSKLERGTIASSIYSILVTLLPKLSNFSRPANSYIPSRLQTQRKMRRRTKKFPTASNVKATHSRRTVMVLLAFATRIRRRSLIEAKKANLLVQYRSSYYNVKCPVSD